jgi:F-type H+-transporting ATPase subunit b
MAAHVVASDNFLLPNATFIAEFIAFLLILGIIWRYIVPYIQGPIRARQALIAKQVEDAEAATKRLKEAEDRYKAALSEARNEAAQIREHARAEAQRTVEEVRAQASEESARILARGEEQLALQRGAIVRELRAEIGTLAVELSEKIVDQQLANDAQVSATVDSFLSGLDAQDKAQSSAQTAGSPS